MKINRYNFKRVYGPFLQQNFWTSFKPEFGRDMHVKEFLHNFRSCKVSSGLQEGCLPSGRAAWVWPWPGLGWGLRALGLQNPHLVSKLGETPGQEPAALQTQRQVLWLLWPMLEGFGTFLFHLKSLLLCGRRSALHPGLSSCFSEPGQKRR